jgi:hypothetical protein
VEPPVKEVSPKIIFPGRLHVLVHPAICRIAVPALAVPASALITWKAAFGGAA